VDDPDGDRDAGTYLLIFPVSNHGL
jgi:hypothetical protein